MFLIFLIININILTINSLKNRIKITSQLDNLKGKYKEKILYGEINESQLMNDTAIILALENKIKSIYIKLNLNTDVLIHLKRITTNVDEYIVFLKILIDKLNSFAKFDTIINKMNQTKITYKIEKDKSSKKKRDINYFKANDAVFKGRKYLNTSLINNHTPNSNHSNDKFNLLHKPEQKIANKVLRIQTNEYNLQSSKIFLFKCIISNFKFIKL
jgi:hypothetical protein